MFAALYPVEKGFFYGLNGSRVNKEAVTQYFSKIQSEGHTQATNWLIDQLEERSWTEQAEKHDFGVLKSRLLQLPMQRVGFMNNGNYDYFEELKHEYRFFLSRAGQKSATPAELKLEPRGPQKSWGGVYQLARNGSDVQIRLRPDNEDVIIVFTIEGIHSLGVGNPEEASKECEPSLKDVSIGKLKDRIRQLKGEEPLESSNQERWEHMPFYITFASHFNNSLCGHARSFSDSSRWMFDQHLNMDKGVLRNAAFEVMRELLALDDELKPTGSRRILIDVKHMSAASRNDFYRTIVRPFNCKPENANHKIPVIASHVGYAGIDTLEEMMKNASRGLEGDAFRSKEFLAWNINLSDEDVIEIHNSGGLIGISFDRHLVGGKQNHWLPRWWTGRWNRTNSARLLTRTLREFIRIPFDYRLADPYRIWDVLCLGSGFDGMMDPISRYSTVLDMPRLEDDIIEILHRLKKENGMWFGTLPVENMARKICFENAYHFVCTNYR